MNYVKAFIAGMIFPSFLIPIGLTAAVFFDRREVLQVLFLHFLPLIWGVWNVLYFSVFRSRLHADLTIRLLLTGFALGALVALYGVLVEHLHQIIGIPASVPLLLAPLVYAIIWRFIVHPLNQLFGLRD